MKILVVFTGGTICSTLENGVIDVDTKKPYTLIEKYKQIDETVEFDTVEPYFILSENLSSIHILKLFSCVKDNLNKDYDGIIVVHGTDTLHYSASALKIMLGKIDIPVLFVSSNFPLEDERANGFDNFCGAINYVNQNKTPSVYVAYKNNGEEVVVHCPEKLLDYDTFSDKLRSIENDVLDEKILDLSDYKLNLKSNILRIKSTVGMTFPTLSNEKCVIIETYHSGTLKTDDGLFFEFVKQAKEKNIPVVLCGVSNGNVYESAKDFKELDNIVMSTFAPIYTYIKCWLLCDNGLDVASNF